MYRHMRRSNSLVPILAFIIACLAIVSGPAATTGADQADEKKGRGGGFDLFVTDDKQTNFEFKGDFALPAGFFDKGSARFEGRVPLKGTPLKTFRSYKVGTTDTIVQRKSTPQLGSSYDSSSTIEIELVALSLESVQPIEVTAGGKTQLWDVKLQVSPSRRSSGKATIAQRSERGGVFSSELTVLGLFKFTRHGDRAERELDLGKKKLGRAQLEALTLRANNVPWERKAPEDVLVVRGLSDGIFVGVENGRRVSFSEESRLVNHGVIPALRTALEPAR